MPSSAKCPESRKNAMLCWIDRGVQTDFQLAQYGDDLQHIPIYCLTVHSLFEPKVTTTFQSATV